MERWAATLVDYRRSFCVWSLVSRGTPERPGLALGLEACPGAECRGIAFRLKLESAESELEATWRREMYTAIYQPKWLNVATDAGVVAAIAFAVDPGHPQHAAGLGPQDTAAIILQRSGKTGPAANILQIPYANFRRSVALNSTLMLAYPVYTHTH